MDCKIEVVKRYSQLWHTVEYVVCIVYDGGPTKEVLFMDEREAVALRDSLNTMLGL